MKIVSWQVVLTEHQVHLLKALGKTPGTSLKVVTACDELEERKAQGWSKPDLDGLDVIPLNRQNWLSTGLSLIKGNPDAVHLFNGLWADRRLFLLLLYAVWKKRKVGLVTEPFGDTQDGYLTDQIKIKGWLLAKLRPLCYGIAGKFLGGHMEAVFAISQKAVQQLLRAGYRNDRVFPFGYFVPPLEDTSGATWPGAVDHKLRIVYVGSLISRKGIDIALEAMRICKARNLGVSLDVYGPGDPALLASGAGHVSYRGLIPFGQAQSVIRNYDVLVLPSRHDGWGGVVNEALLQGVPVICSDQVGAKVLIENSGAGAVFANEDATHFADLLMSLAKNPQRLHSWHEAALAYRPMLMPETAAGYMYQCLQYAFRKKDVRPSCPWWANDL